MRRAKVAVDGEGLPDFAALPSFQSQSSFDNRSAAMRRSGLMTSIDVLTPPSWLQVDAQGSFIAAALDTETSGLDSGTDHVIEVGIQLFRFELPSGKVTGLLESHSALQDPGFPIPLEIQRVTGITPSMLVGQKIDWTQVDALLSRADVILAHNAAFDRGFVDRKSLISPNKAWACTSMQVDWRAKGFKNAKLQDLCGALGIVYDPHRAMSDVNAMIRLIGSDDVFTGRTYLAEILASAREAMVWLWIEGKTFEHKELLKAHGLRWNGALKEWGKLVPAADHESQRAFMQALLPGFQVQSRPMGWQDRFKTR